ncbi:hypothetical protein [Nannocystis pusilla]|uniref:hypothetical protein n=1 Tax=Nannocystis pusilla TaxID=889268 RepID=UPI003DA5E874
MAQRVEPIGIITDELAWRTGRFSIDDEDAEEGRDQEAPAQKASTETRATTKTTASSAKNTATTEKPPAAPPPGGPPRPRPPGSLTSQRPRGVTAGNSVARSPVLLATCDLAPQPAPAIASKTVAQCRPATSSRS